MHLFLLDQPYIFYEFRLEAQALCNGCSCSEVTEHQEKDIWHISGYETKTVIYKHLIS